MGGLLILFFGALYVWGAFKVVGVVKQKWANTLLILITILIPTADAIYGRIKLKQMCAAEGGLKIFQSVEAVTGFSTGEDTPYESWVTKFGYSYVEGYRFGASNKQTIRYESNGAGGVTTKIEPNGVLRSRYLLQHTEVDSGTYLRRQEAVVDIVSGKTMSTDTAIIYFGGWVERAMSAVYASRGTADYCPKPDDSYQPLITLVTQTLKPISGK